MVDFGDIDGAGMILMVARWWNGDLWTVPLTLSDGAGASTLRLVPAP